MTTTETAPSRSNTKARIVLQLLSVLLQNESVTMPISKVLNAMRRRVEYEEKQFDAIESEMESLEEAFCRYRDLEETISQKAGLIDRLQRILDEHERRSELQDLKLWEVLEVYLMFANEAQIADILAFLEFLGYHTTRQAIESTVKTHKSRFLIRKEGWDRFISLVKGKENNASSTSKKRK